MRNTILTALLFLFSACSLINAPEGNVPRIQSVAPESFLHTRETIRISFSTPMDKESIEQALSFAGPQGPVDGRIRWEGGDTLSFTPASIESPFRYLLVIDGALGAEGIPMKHPFRRYFTTVPDSPTPTIESCLPADGTEGIPPETDIELRFSKSLERESLYSAFRLLPSAEGRFIWKDGDTLLRYKTDTPLVRGLHYRIEISRECMSLDGVPLSESFSSSFSVEEEVKAECSDITVESSGSTEPADSQQLYTVEKDETIRFHFLREIPTSRRDGIYSISPEVSHSSEWNSSGDQLTVSLEEPLSWRKIYTFSFPQSDFLFICEGENSRPIEVEEVFFCNDLTAAAPVFTSLELNELLTPSSSSTAAVDIHFRHAEDADLVYEDLLDSIGLYADNGSAVITMKELEVDPSSPESPPYSASLPESMKTRVRLSFSIEVLGNSGKLVIEISEDLFDSFENRLIHPFYLSVNL